MNAFDSAISHVNQLSQRMKEAALSEQWDCFKTLDHERQSVLRLLRFDNFRQSVSVDRFATAVESLLALNNDLVEIVENSRSQAATALAKYRQNKKASDAYGEW
jgi:hypothetical protein